MIILPYLPALKRAGIFAFLLTIETNSYAFTSGKRTLLVGSYLSILHLWSRKRLALLSILSITLFAVWGIVFRSLPGKPVSVVSYVPALSAVKQRKPITNLLNNAVKVANTAHWILPRGGNVPNYATYFWASDRYLLYFRHHPRIWDLLCRRDVKTGKDKIFWKVSRWWSEDGTYKKQLEISPDRQWVLWEGNYYDHSFHGYYGARLDGSRKFFISKKPWPYWVAVRWLPDSRHFLEVTHLYKENGDYLRCVGTTMRSVVAPRLSQRPPALNKYTYSESWNKYSDIKWLTNTKALGVSALGELWPARSYIIEELTTNRNAKNRRWTFRIPRQETRYEMAIAPQGDRIAWVVVETDNSLSSHKGNAKLCISGLNGKITNEIGSLPLAPSEEEWPGFYRPTELKWLPDGKNLSFIYEDKLYRVQVE